jgi:hypothetical protein
MTQIMSTTQYLPKEAVLLERVSGYDGQGLPVYDSVETFAANVMEYDAGRQQTGAEFVIGRDGSQYVTALTLYIQGDEAVVPSEEDRITIDSTRTFIVREKKTVHGLEYTRAEPDHYRLRCSREAV